MDGNRVLGVVRLDRVRAVPAVERERRSVRDIAEPVEPLDPSDSLDRAVERMGRATLDVLPVALAGRLVGVLRRIDVERFLSLRSLDDLGSHRLPRAPS